MFWWNLQKGSSLSLKWNDDQKDRADLSRKASLWKARPLKEPRRAVKTLPRWEFRPDSEAEAGARLFLVAEEEDLSRFAA